MRLIVVKLLLKIKIKKAFSEDLPVTRNIIDLAEQEKICAVTNKPLVKIHEEISQKLAYKAGSYFIKEFIRPKYSSSTGTEETIFTAPMPECL